MGREIYEPPGLRFMDRTRGEMLLCEDEKSGWNGWLFYRHPDGQWVSLRKATPEDLEAIRILKSNQAGPREGYR